MKSQAGSLAQPFGPRPAICANRAKSGPLSHSHPQYLGRYSRRVGVVL